MEYFNCAHCIAQRLLGRLSWPLKSNESLIFQYRTQKSSFFFLRPEPLAYAVLDLICTWYVAMQRFEFISFFFYKHVHITFEIIIQCCQHGKTTTRKDSNTSDYIQWKNGELGDLLDVWGIDLKKNLQGVFQLNQKSVWNNCMRN